MSIPLCYFRLSTFLLVDSKNSRKLSSFFLESPPSADGQPKRVTDLVPLSSM